MSSKTLTREAYLALVHRPGAFQAVSWKSSVKPAAAHKGVDLVKVCTAVIRTGVEYANLAVNEGVDTGALPWGEWAVYPFIVTHRGQDYARLYVNDGSVRASHFVNGTEVSRDEFLSFLTPSARESKRSTGGTITVKLESLQLL